MHRQRDDAETGPTIRHGPVLRGRAGLIGGLAALSGILFGLDTGVMSGALDLITQEFVLSDFQRESMVGVMLLGAAMGVLGAAWLSHRCGRKRTLVLTAALFVVGPLLCAPKPRRTAHSCWRGCCWGWRPGRPRSPRHFILPKLLIPGVGAR
nr:MFS transporter [Komagataeibacter oboediens]